MFRDWLQAVYDEVKDQVDGRGAQDPQGRGLIGGPLKLSLPALSGGQGGGSCALPDFDGPVSRAML